MLEQNAAERIHRVEDAHTNWYLVEDGAGGGLTVVDTGLPRSWESLHTALEDPGRTAGRRSCPRRGIRTATARCSSPTAAR